MHIAVDTLGHLLALAVAPANEQDRDQVGQLAQAVQAEVEEPVKVAFVAQGYTGEQPAEAAACFSFSESTERAKLDKERTGSRKSAVAASHGFNKTNPLFRRWKF